MISILLNMKTDRNKEFDWAQSEKVKLGTQHIVVNVLHLKTYLDLQPNTMLN